MVLESAYLSIDFVQPAFYIVFDCFYCYWRLSCHDHSLTSDILILLLSDIWIIATNENRKLILSSAIARVILHTMILIFAIFQTPKTTFADVADAVRDNKLHRSFKSSSWTRPLIYPSRTTHTRSFPQKHSFSYSYLLVGIPVGSRRRVNGLLSIDCPTSAPSLLTVDASDYLARETGSLGLREKLDFYLESKNVAPQRYPFAFLVTAPRLMGYSFNPASFWYLYDANKTLSAMIVEVNNTFDERRMYFLESSRPASNTGKASFTKKWEKDFHVSPFNEREGSYSLRAHDPLAQVTTYEREISNTITLSTEKNKPKIVARIFSTTKPIDPSTITPSTAAALIFRFGWVGFLTFPRIIREAFHLFFRKKLPVWYRPEVRPASISRQPTETERIIEIFFHQFLKHIVNMADCPVRLTYEAPSGMGKTILRECHSHQDREPNLPLVEIRVLSPAFYSRFVHYANVKEGFDHECFHTETQNITISITNPELFLRLLPCESSNILQSTSLARFQQLGNLEKARWVILRWLRCMPAPQSYQSISNSLDTRKSGTRYAPLSLFDLVVASKCSDAGLYRRKLIQLFIAQRFTLGLTSVTAWLDIGLKVFLVKLEREHRQKLFDKSRLTGVTKTKEEPLHLHSTYKIGYFMLSLVLMNCLHFWSHLKGF